MNGEREKSYTKTDRQTDSKIEEQRYEDGERQRETKR